jgi:hypothetical protein
MPLAKIPVSWNNIGNAGLKAIVGAFGAQVLCCLFDTSLVLIASEKSCWDTP